ncbi:MAG TPA: NAD-dependent epimerase/dehydratase family protein [Candidatus Thermoplasmatota archaeon]|nr:NAD-dependent epimerase/dehydratase family protein [Candidatus Thermoplasmatota archaeon]
MRALVTGGAGFIGSHLVDRLLAQGHEVVVFDNLSSGRTEFLAQHAGNPRLSILHADLLDLGAITRAIVGVDAVWHLAANPDIRYGMEHTDWDLKQNAVATYNVLEAMRKAGCKRIAFASTSTIYGERVAVPTPEDAAPVLPISLYGASKLAGEAYVSAFVGTFGLQAWIFRFANIIGPRGTHGVIVDFVEKLKKDRTRLEVLGDGRQSKSYLMVDELVDAMLLVVDRAKEPINVYNLGSSDALEVRRIAELVLDRTGQRGARIAYTGGARGWAGDVPRMLLDTTAVNRLGWKAKRTSEEAVREAVEAIVAERW